jgi:hypothetical protein
LLLKFRIARRRMLAVILEAVEILVTLAAFLASVWLFLFHSYCSWIRYRCKRIDN